MNKLRRTKFFASVYPVDIVLMLFLLVLLIHAGVSLFSEQGVSQERTTIDIIVRTSAAAIFGYFLSAPAASASSGTTATGGKAVTLVSSEKAADAPQNAIGFQTSDAGETLTPGSAHFISFGGGRRLSYLPFDFAKLRQRAGIRRRNHFPISRLYCREHRLFNQLRKKPGRLRSFCFSSFRETQTVIQ